MPHFWLKYPYANCKNSWDATHWLASLEGLRGIAQNGSKLQVVWGIFPRENFVIWRHRNPTWHVFHGTFCLRKYVSDLCHSSAFSGKKVCMNVPEFVANLLTPLWHNISVHVFQLAGWPRNIDCVNQINSILSCLLQLFYDNTLFYFVTRMNSLMWYTGLDKF